MRRIKCLKLLRCQSQCEGDGVFLYVRRGAGFGNCNDVTAADGPGQRDGCRRATARSANLCKHGITQQPGAGAAERRIGHWGATGVLFFFDRGRQSLAARRHGCTVQAGFGGGLLYVVRRFLFQSKFQSEIFNVAKIYCLHRGRSKRVIARVVPDRLTGLYRIEWPDMGFPT